MSDVSTTNNDILADALMLGQNAAAAGIKLFIPKSTSLYSSEEKESIEFKGYDGGSEVSTRINVKHLTLISGILDILCRENNIEVGQLEKSEA